MTSAKKSSAPSRAMLHFICGKIGSGKSTLATQLAAAPHTILLNEDQWLSTLYPKSIKTITDYARCAGLLRTAITPHIQQLLAAGISVVLDFPANTLASRAWMKSLCDSTSAPHILHFLDLPDDICKARLHQRNISGTHPYQTSEAEFDAISSYFVAPTEEEGFTVQRYNADNAPDFPHVHRVVAIHHSEFPDPISFTKGTTLTVGAKYAGPEGWDNWFFCTLPTHSGGWVPSQIIDRKEDSPSEGVALEDYTAQELNVKIGEIVTVLKELNGWMWCKSMHSQQSGWVPAASLAAIM